MDTEKIAARLVAGTDPSTEVGEIVKEIARLQSDRRDILNKAGDKVRAIDLDLAKADERLKALVGWEKGAAAVVMKHLKYHRVDTGMMSSRTVDAIDDATKGSLYPTPWPVDKSRWEIIEG